MTDPQLQGWQVMMWIDVIVIIGGTIWFLIHLWRKDRELDRFLSEMTRRTMERIEQQDRERRDFWP